LVAPVIAKPQPELFPAHTPFVSLHSNHAIPGVINIESDEEKGAQDIVQHLLQQGHTDILHLAGPAGMLGTRRRLTGFKKALAAAKPRRIVARSIEGGFSSEDAASALRTWMRDNQGATLPTALFCANDASALGCMEVLSQAGLRVPHDISIAGFDDTIAARTSVPQLTTIRQPLRQMGGKAVELIVNRDQNPRPESDNIVFPTQTMFRASVAQPPKKPIPVPDLR
jgi:LacI family transcriptional regulator